MKSVLAAGTVLSLLCASPCAAGQVIRSHDGPVKIVDHGSYRGRSARAKAYAAKSRSRDRHIDEVAPAEGPAVTPVNAMVADRALSVLGMRIQGSPTVDVPDIAVDPTAYDLRVVGAVATAVDSDIAAAHAMNLGTRSVRNELSVLADWPAQDGKVEPREFVYSDAQVRFYVERVLLARPALHASPINVEVADGVARLTGSVASSEQYEMASTAAASAIGVTLVRNDLSIQPD
jgi:osmotically-inducible protein OsmY